MSKITKTMKNGLQLWVQKVTWAGTQCSEFPPQARLILCQYMDNFAALVLNCFYILNILIRIAWTSLFHCSHDFMPVLYVSESCMALLLFSRGSCHILHLVLCVESDLYLLLLQFRRFQRINPCYIHRQIWAFTTTVTVLELQYKYLAIDTTVLLAEETRSARSHNIDAGEEMAMFSALKKMAPNATICFLALKMMAGKNRTVDYLDMTTFQNSGTVACGGLTSVIPHDIAAATAQWKMQVLG